MSIIDDSGQSIIRCEFCHEECRSDQISYVNINGVIWKLGPFCKDFANEETANQVLNNIHPNNIELAWGAILAWEWRTDNIDYI
jgi:hypothetical protein